MDEKSLNLIRRENIKKLTSSTPQLEQKVASAEFERQYCKAADPVTGFCDVPEKQALNVVSKFAQDHRHSSLILSGNSKGHQKKKSIHEELADENKTELARRDLINSLRGENSRLHRENFMLQERIDAIQELIGKLRAEENETVTVDK